MISPEHRAVFSDELRQRRRGRPRSAVRKIPKCVYVPEAVVDEYCRASLKQRASVNVLMAEAIIAYVRRLSTSS